MFKYLSVDLKQRNFSKGNQNKENPLALPY